MPDARPDMPPWFDHLDPGVAPLVRLLHEAGFVTTDSGDGSSKADAIAEGEALDFAHVFAVAAPEYIVAEASRLRRVLSAAEYGAEAWEVTASYDPDSGVALLGVVARQPPPSWLCSPGARRP